jgi:hypothetical protein
MWNQIIVGEGIWVPVFTKAASKIHIIEVTLHMIALFRITPAETKRTNIR